MRPSHFPLLRRASSCAVTVAAFSLTGATAHAATPATKARCPSQNVALTATNTNVIRDSILCLTNAERMLNHLTPLRENAKLRKAALAHSSDMVRRSYFSHTAPSGSTFVDRILRSDYTRRNDAWALGENLAWGTGGLGTARGVHDAWMRSGGHRATILRPSYRELGIGIHLGIPTDADVGATYTTNFGAKL